jgi:D-3-phosphoglycerate dehydrogenase
MPPNPSPTVVVTDSDFPDLDIEREVFDELGAELVAGDARSPEEVIETGADADADALLVQYAPITREVFEALDLTVVGRYGIGYDCVDVEAATDHGVAVVNVPSYCVEEVATHALSLLLACVRRVPQYDRTVRSGTWDWTRERPIPRLSGRTLGLAGFGKLPRKLAAMVSGFELDVVAFDPYVDETEMAERGVERVDFDELLARSDLLSVHTPLTPETEGLFDRAAFDAMQPTAVLVNTSRGAVVDVDALAAALDAGDIAAAGLDVLPEEPPDDLPLLDRHDAVVTPHVAWYSEASLVELRRTVSEDVARALRGEAPTNVVNPEVRSS